MNCPNDGSGLARRLYEGDVSIDECPTCYGTWTERGEIERIQSLREHDHRADLHTFDDTVGRAIEFARQAERPPGRCPVCDLEMVEEDYGYGSQILVERCTDGHGVWLDAGELESLEVWFERNRESAKEPVGILGVLATLQRRYGGG